MRWPVCAMLGLAALAAPQSAPAATIVVYADPVTMERHTVIVSLEGPDRAFLCMLPPAVAGCQEVPIVRLRG